MLCWDFGQLIRHGIVYVDRIEKQKLELERLEAERERILLERERERMEYEREEQRRNMALLK